MTDSQRNLAILGAIAVAGALIGGAFDSAAFNVNLLLNIAFTVVMTWFLVITYQKHSGTIAQMPIGPRLVLQGSGIALVAIFVTGSLRAGFLPYPPFGWSNTYPLYFWGSIILCGFGLWWSWQQRTSRW